MRLLVLCIFAVCCCCCSLVNAARSITKMHEIRKLREVLLQLSDVKKSVQLGEKMLNSPPDNIEDCCCLSALECFRENMKEHFNVREKKQSKLFKSLKNRYTLSGLNFCKSGNDTLSCHDCDSHPKVNVEEFFNRLGSLIERALSRLMMD